MAKLNMNHCFSGEAMKLRKRNNFLDANSTGLAFELKFSQSLYNKISKMYSPYVLSAIIEITSLCKINGFRPWDLNTQNYINRLLNGETIQDVITDFLNDYGICFTKKKLISEEDYVSNCKKGHKYPIVYSIYNQQKSRTSKRPTLLLSSENDSKYMLLAKARLSVNDEYSLYTGLQFLYQALDRKLPINTFPSYEDTRCGMHMYYNVVQELTILIGEIEDFYLTNQNIPLIVADRLNSYFADMEDLFYS